MEATIVNIVRRDYGTVDNKVSVRVCTTVEGGMEERAVADSCRGRRGVHRLRRIREEVGMAVSVKLGDRRC